MAFEWVLDNPARTDKELTLVLDGNPVGRVTWDPPAGVLKGVWRARLFDQPGVRGDVKLFESPGHGRAAARGWLEDQHNIPDHEHRVRVGIGKLERLGPFRSSRAIDRLQRTVSRLEHVVGPLSVERGAFLAGGCVLRPLLATFQDVGWPTPPPDHDFDLFVPEKGSTEVIGALADAFTRREGDSSDELRELFWDDEIGNIDVIVTPNDPATTIARFDFRCAAVATDGARLLFVANAPDDIRQRRLVPLRPTRVSRVQKYLVGFGLDPGVGLDVDDIGPGVPGWTLPEDAGPDSIFARNVPSTSVEIDRAMLLAGGR